MDTNGEEKRPTDANSRNGEACFFNDGQTRCYGASQKVDSETQATDCTRSRPDALGQIYFIETADEAYVKIGYSKRVVARLSDLGTLRPGNFALRLIGSFPGSHATEKWLHEKFASDRDGGEWFRSSPALRDFISVIGLLPPITVVPQKRGRKRILALPVVEPAGSDVSKDLISVGSVSVEVQPVRPKGSITAIDMGRMGGLERAKRMTAEQRSTVARKAVLVRWSKNRVGGRVGRK
jgi:hypothetical protein